MFKSNQFELVAMYKIFFFCRASKKKKKVEGEENKDGEEADAEADGEGADEPAEAEKVVRGPKVKSNTPKKPKPSK